MPRRSLLVLAAAVLAAHWWILGAATTAPVRVRDRAIVPTFVTRSIVPSVRPDVVPQVPPEWVSEPARFPARAVTPVRKAAREIELAVTAASLAEPPAPVEAVATTAPPTVAHEPKSTPAASTPPTLRFSIPASAQLHYQVTASVRSLHLQGNGELLWHHDGASYDAKLEIRSPLLPPRIQHSTGLITAEGLAPVRFSDKARSEEAAHFQRDQGKVTFSNNRPDAPLAAGTQDRLSVMLQLGAMVGGDPRKFPAGTVISIPTASTREAEPWQFTVEGVEALELPGGNVTALRLIRNPRREFDQKVELWLAPGMDYLPVRLRLTQANGDWVDQQWSSTDRR